ncbi:MAG: hypothetical protein HY064_10940 [Bacteroidetes bacterium]|nr:hypothetical protein [Bacteroidota bacterium]
MKTFFLLFIFIFIFSLAHAQIGVSIYPLSNMVSVRWNPVKVVRDSSGARFETNYRFRAELRTSVTITNDRRGTNVTALPELGFFTRIRGKEGEPMLLSGAGLTMGISRNGIVSGGIFFPLVMELRPQMKITNHFVFDAEADAMFTVNSNRQMFHIRPIFSVGWVF